MNREALVVGINKYYYPLKELLKPAKDAEEVAKMLEKHGGFWVKRLPLKLNPDGPPQVLLWDGKKNGQNPRVRKEDLEAEIELLFNPPTDIPGEIPHTAILFFAGHGFVEDIDGVKDGFLATSTAKGKKRDGTLVGVSLSWLRSVLVKSPVRQKLVWLDCCHSGHLLNIDERFSDDLGRDKDTCLIAASRSFEEAEEQIRGYNGVFTAALLEALDFKNHEDSWVTNHSLTKYIEDKLRRSNQRPVYRNFGNEIVITGDSD
ncbi:MAG: caspase domain-containing protein [Hormoscilla sp.]